MSLHSYHIAALAGQHRRDVTGHAETYRRARAARSSRAAPARHAASLTNIIQRKITARPAVPASAPRGARAAVDWSGARAGRGALNVGHHVQGTGGRP
jgi:hypothetical protein